MLSRLVPDEGTLDMEHRTDVGPPNKRQRKAKSCEQCRNRKVRCDQEVPCGPCRRSRDRLTCTYRDSAADRPEGDAVPDPPALTNGTSMERGAPERSYAHESSSVELVDGGPGPPSTSWTALDASQDRGIAQRHIQSNGLQDTSASIGHALQDEKIWRLEQRIKRLEDEVRSRPSRAGNEEATAAENMSRSNLTIPSVAPTISMKMEKVEFFSQSHWVHTAEKVISAIPGPPDHPRHCGGVKYARSQADQYSCSIPGLSILDSNPL